MKRLIPLLTLLALLILPNTSFAQTSTVPSAPIYQNDTSGDTTATINFAAPTSDGGSPITGYEYTLDYGVTWIPTPGSPIILTGLTNGRMYHLSVRAFNANGAGPESVTTYLFPNTPLPEYVPTKYPTLFSVFPYPIEQKFRYWKPGQKVVIQVQYKTYAVDETDKTLGATLQLKINKKLLDVVDAGGATRNGNTLQWNLGTITGEQVVVRSITVAIKKRGKYPPVGIRIPIRGTSENSSTKVETSTTTIFVKPRNPTPR